MPEIFTSARSKYYHSECAIVQLMMHIINTYTINVYMCWLARGSTIIMKLKRKNNILSKMRYCFENNFSDDESHQFTI